MEFEIEDVNDHSFTQQGQLLLLKQGIIQYGCLEHKKLSGFIILAYSS